jgi:hypothetical protein
MDVYSYTMFFLVTASFEVKKSIDFQSENPLPSTLLHTLRQTRQYDFIHDVIEEIAYE